MIWFSICGRAIQRPGKERARERVLVRSIEVETGEVNSHSQTQKCVCVAGHHPLWLQPVSPVGTDGRVGLDCLWETVNLRGWTMTLIQGQWEPWKALEEGSGI